MYAWDTGSATNPYNGTGTKGWIPITGGSTVKDNVPTVAAQGNTIFTPYRLMYQLAQSVDEPITYEGSLMLHEGDNQVEVGTGIVVREAVRPMLDGTNFYIASAETNSYWNPSKVSHIVSKYISVFKDGICDRWRFANSSGAGWMAVISRLRFDSTSAYSVTYIVRDTYAIGIAPQIINAEYAPNIRESVESLVREVVEARTETSVLQNTKAQKQQPRWIEGTLINEFTGAVRYTQSDNGFVSVQFTVTISNTTLNTLICRLPKDYLPYASVVSAPTVNNNTGSTGAGFGINRTLGGLVISGTPHFNVGQVVVGQITYRKHMGE